MKSKNDEFPTKKFVEIHFHTFSDSIPLIAKMTISPELAHRLLPGPVTLVFNRSPLLPDSFNPDVASVGVRVPDSSIVVAICSRLGVPLAQTSANLSGSTLNPTAVEDFNDLLPHIDLVLDGGRIPSGRFELGFSFAL